VSSSLQSPVSASSAVRPVSVFLLLVPFALAYGASYFFRNVNAVAGPILAREFALGPADLGLLTSAYFFTFSLAQIPLGMALDRYGPARVNAVMALAGALGALLFGMAQDVAGLTLGRALIGLGAGAALMSAMSAVHLWVPREKVATAIGLIMCVGGAGALAASTPTQVMIDAIGWRHMFLILAGLTALFAAGVFATRGQVRPAAQAQTFRELAGGVVTVFSNGPFWLVCLPMMLTLGTMLAFQSLWAATWMRDVAGYGDKGEIGNVLFALNFGMTLSFLLAGWIGDLFARRGYSRLAVIKMAFVLALLAQAWLMAAPAFLPHVAWGFFAFAANSLVPAYALLASWFAPALTGRVNTAVNVLCFSMAFVLQWVIGALLARYPSVGGHYAAAGYYIAWVTLLVLQVAAFAWMVYRVRDRAPVHA
jgi:MFS family permease